jgi:predicted AlkP superfamily phosphohydrolase/phosphomutase
VVKNLVQALILLVFFSPIACRSEIETEPEHPVVVIGIDGATWDVIDPMIAAGELPSFKQLVDRGARADLIVTPPLISPVVWTTFATGTFARRHNILDFTYPYVTGEKHQVETSQRREPAIWNVASDHQRTVGVVGYYVTHPAEVINGFIVSDQLLKSRSGSTYPPELGAEIELIRSQLERAQLFKRFFPWDYNRQDSENPKSPHFDVSRVVRGRVDSSIIASENVRRCSLKLMPRGVDLFMTYYQLIDHVSHSTWLYFDPSDFDYEPNPRSKELLGNIIPEAYRYIDEYLAEVMSQVGPQANIILISDHGFGSATGKFAIRDQKLASVLTGNHRFKGILLAAGPDIKPGSYNGLTIMDVAPLILSLLRLPISEELPGRVPDEMLASDFLERAAPEPASAYSKQWAFVDTTPADLETDSEDLEQLKALGYIDSSTRAGRSASEPEHDIWSADQNLRRNALVGELLFYHMRQRTEEIRQLMAQVNEHDPNLTAILTDHVKAIAKVMQDEFSFSLFPDNAIESFGYINDLSATVRVEPSPVQVCDGSKVVAVSVHWQVSEAQSNVEIRIDRPNGKLLTSGGTVGSAKTGAWARNGMSFYLVEKDTGKALAVDTLRFTTSGCPTE